MNDVPHRSDHATVPADLHDGVELHWCGMATARGSGGAEIARCLDGGNLAAAEDGFQRKTEAELERRAEESEDGGCGRGE